MLWTVSTNGNIQTLELGTSGFAVGINGASPVQVVGYTSGQKRNAATHATLWTVDIDGTVTTLDLGEGFARAIDKSAPEGLTRVVGNAIGKKRGEINSAILWTVQ